MQGQSATRSRHARTQLGDMLCSLCKHECKESELRNYVYTPVPLTALRLTFSEGAPRNPRKKRSAHAPRAAKHTHGINAAVLAFVLTILVFVLRSRNKFYF